MHTQNKTVNRHDRKIKLNLGMKILSGISDSWRMTRVEPLLSWVTVCWSLWRVNVSLKHCTVDKLVSRSNRSHTRPPWPALVWPLTSPAHRPAFLLLVEIILTPTEILFTPSPQSSQCQWVGQIPGNYGLPPPLETVRLLLILPTVLMRLRVDNCRDLHIDTERWSGITLAFIDLQIDPETKDWEECRMSFVQDSISQLLGPTSVCELEAYEHTHEEDLNHRQSTWQVW